jgi:hypothetical protein
VAVLVLAAVLYAVNREKRDIPVLIAARDIPAYHVITSSDLVLGTRAGDRRGTYASLPVEGRLTLTAIGKNQPLHQSQIAPDIASVLPGPLTVHGFAATRATVLNGALQAGDRVELLLVDDDKRLALRDADDVALDRLSAVVLSVTGNSETPTLVVALRTEEADANEVAIAIGTAVVFKDPAAPPAPR